MSLMPKGVTGIGSGFNRSFPDNSTSNYESVYQMPTVSKEMQQYNLNTVSNRLAPLSAQAKPENDNFFRILFESFRPSNVVEGYKIIGNKAGEVVSDIGSGIKNAIFLPLLIGGAFVAWRLLRK